MKFFCDALFQGVLCFKLVSLSFYLFNRLVFETFLEGIYLYFYGGIEFQKHAFCFIISSGLLCYQNWESDVHLLLFVTVYFIIGLSYTPKSYSIKAATKKTNNVPHFPIQCVSMLCIIFLSYNIAS